MMTETLMHIDEELTETQQHDLLAAMGNSEFGMQAQHQSSKNHLFFVAYDSERITPHELVAIANGRGFHAQLVDL